MRPESTAREAVPRWVSLLTIDQILQVEEALPGRLMWLYPFKTMPGGQYEFRVAVGRAAIKQAIEKATMPAVVDAPTDDARSWARV